MIHPKLFPSVLIVLSIAAAIGYGLAGDWRRFTYWLAAAGLQTAVTF